MSSPPTLFLHHLPQAHGLLVCGIHPVHSSIKTLVPMLFLGTLFIEIIKKLQETRILLTASCKELLYIHTIPEVQKAQVTCSRSQSSLIVSICLEVIIFDSRVCSFPWQGTYQCQCISSVQFSRSVVSDSLRPHESQHARPHCPSPTPGVHPDSCSSSQWCHPAISSSVVPFSSCPQSLPASGSFPMSQLFAWGGQSTGVSALA